VVDRERPVSGGDAAEASPRAQEGGAQEQQQGRSRKKRSLLPMMLIAGHWRDLCGFRALACARLRGLPYSTVSPGT
jgi:hypothetical protein